MWRKLISFLFSFAFLLYLVLFLLENLFPGIVSTLFPLTSALYPVLLLGILTALFPTSYIPQIATQISIFDVLLTIGLSVFGVILIYTKIDIATPLRLIITTLSGILILFTSLLVIIPEGYRFTRPRFRAWYILILLMVLTLGYFIVKQVPRDAKNTETTITRLAPEKYSLLLVNNSQIPNYLTSYRQLFINAGYWQIHADEETPAYREITTTTIMFGDEDSIAGDEIATLLRQSYGTVQTAPPPADNPPHTIIVILGRPQEL